MHRELMSPVKKVKTDRKERNEGANRILIQITRTRWLVQRRTPATKAPPAGLLGIGLFRTSDILVGCGPSEGIPKLPTSLLPV